MDTYTINTTLFGKLDIPADEGIFEEFTITLGETEMTLNLCIEENFINDSNLQAITSLIEHIPEMYGKGKQRIWETRESSELIRFFVTWHLDNLDGLDEIFETEDEVTYDMITKKLEPRLIRIGQDKHGNIDCVFDFSLPEEYADDLLVVIFNDKFEIDKMTYES